MIRPKRQEKNILGWREWVTLPKFHIHKIKAKVDSGARTSTLHATDIEIYRIKHRLYVKFKIFPNQKNDKWYKWGSSELIDVRTIKSSDGHQTVRPIIMTEIKIGQNTWPIELSLVNRKSMGFRMLLGREAIKERFVVEPGKSFLSRHIKRIRK